MLESFAILLSDASFQLRIETIVPDRPVSQMVTPCWPASLIRSSLVTVEALLCV